jgi:hypothetical protein
MPHAWKPFNPNNLSPYQTKSCVMICVSCGSTWDMNGVISTNSPLWNMSCEEIVIRLVTET